MCLCVYIYIYFFFIFISLITWSRSIQVCCIPCATTYRRVGICKNCSFQRGPRSWSIPDDCASFQVEAAGNLLRTKPSYAVTTMDLSVDPPQGLQLIMEYPTVACRQDSELPFLYDNFQFRALVQHLSPS